MRSILMMLLTLGSICAACSPVAVSTVDRHPKPCAVVYSIARCEAMTDMVAAEVGKDRDDVVSVAIVPDAPPGGTHLSAGWHVRIRVAMRDGSSHDTLICGGVLHEPACADDPHLEVRAAIDAGYHDVPKGSSPIPSIEPASVLAASPILVPSISIPIDHRGTYEVSVGDGSLPNGVWSSGSVGFADAWPGDLALRDATVILELRSLEPGGKPFANAYDHGWRPGVERVRAVLRFDVVWFKPGATLELRNLSVR